MKSSHVLLPLLAALSAAVLAGAARAADEEVQALTKEQLAQFDKGPTAIDVSAYPPGIREIYPLFRQKCSVCHTIARPINCTFALPDEWSRYIKRMMHKPGSGISNAEGKQIYEFLVYDSSVRKKSLLEEKLTKATADEKSQAEAKIKEVHDKYDKK